ncbi:Maintenance of telomere capping protein 6 [Bienertia sinuspersici]
MASISPTHSSIWSSGAQKHCFSQSLAKAEDRDIQDHYFLLNQALTQALISFTIKAAIKPENSMLFVPHHWDNSDPTEPEDENSKKEPSKPEGQPAGGNSDRDNLERIIGVDDSRFSGADLAALIRNKYGRSYDVQLIKKEFMGRNLLAMNVMWKYREQRSFPLTEEEYILRLDDVANNLRCWGAVSHIRNSLAKLKERPRIGKAVSIFIDMDESGARSNEWIYK